MQRCFPIQYKLSDVFRVTLGSQDTRNTLVYSKSTKYKVQQDINNNCNNCRAVLQNTLGEIFGYTLSYTTKYTFKQPVQLRVSFQKYWTNGDLKFCFVYGFNLTMYNIYCVKPYYVLVAPAGCTKNSLRLQTFSRQKNQYATSNQRELDSTLHLKIYDTPMNIDQ